MPSIVRVLFPRTKVVEVFIRSGFNAEGVIECVIQSKDVAKLHQEMTIYHLDSYIPSAIDPPLSLASIRTSPDIAGLLESCKIEGLVGYSPLIGIQEWPLLYGPNDVPFLIDGPDTLASLVEQARSQKHLSAVRIFHSAMK